MANPWGIPQPPDVDFGIWQTAEAFANEHYQDVEGNWISDLGIHGAGGIDFPAIFRAQWAELADDKERWLYLLRWRLDTLVDEGFLEDLIKFALPYLFGLPGVPDLPDIPSTGNPGPILDGIDDLIREGDGAIRSLTAAANSALVDTTRTSTDLLSNLGAVLLGILDDRNRQSTDAIGSIYSESTRSLDALLGRSTTGIDDLTGKALGAIEAVLAGVFDGQSDVIGKIFGVIDGALDQSTDNNRRVTDAIERALDNDIEQSRRNADAIERGISGSIGELTDFTSGALGEISRALGNSDNAQADATTQGAAEVSARLEGGFRGLVESLARFTGDEKSIGPEATRDRIDKAFSAVMAQGNCPSDFVEFVHDFVDKLTADWDPLTPLLHIMTEVNMWQSIFNPAFTVLGNCIAQAAARAVPTSLPDAGQLQEQLRRGLIQKDEAMSDLFSQGFTPERADRLLAGRRQLPDILFIQTWFLRGMITADQAFEYLTQKGFDLDDSQAILQMAYTIPPPSDLITMAVREVFSPQIAQRFGQFEDFPKDFADYARQQGISEEWAQRYWAAHWGLPSPQQGFEMYQRDVISFNDLQLLLKSLDIMPFWRDRLTKIAFRPITRIDIRRMHQLGLLSHDEMVTRYRHMGYSPEDAAFMAQFTERLNGPKGEQDIEELEGATKATILQLFRRGVITSQDATALLKEMGTGDRAINVLLTNERTKLELERRDQETDLILEEASAGVITTEQAADRLGALGLTATEQATATAKLRKIAARQTKLPTRAEGEKMYKAKVLGPLEYASLLKQLGYSNFWSAKFIQLAETGDA